MDIDSYLCIAMDDDSGHGLKRLFIAAMLIVGFYIVAMRVVPLLPEAYLPVAKKSVKTIAGCLFVVAGIFVYHSSKSTNHGR